MDIKSAEDLKLFLAQAEEMVDQGKMTFAEVVKTLNQVVFESTIFGNHEVEETLQNLKELSELVKRRIPRDDEEGTKAFILIHKIVSVLERLAK